MKNKIEKLIGFFLIVLMVVVGFPFVTHKAQAAALTTLSDVQTNQSASALSAHTIAFVTPSGVTAGQTVKLTFSNNTAVANLSGTPSNDVYIMVAGAPATVSGVNGVSTWGATTTATSVTFTAPASGSFIPSAGAALIFIVGNTASTTSGTNRITNFTSATTTIMTIGGTMADTAQIALPVVTNDIVNITATVAPSITFTIDANSLQFGTLNSASARWATTTSGGSGADVVGNILTIATNSTSGYNITLQGSTLTASTGTITPITGSPAASSPGSAQFGLYAIETGGAASATTTTNYRTSGSYYFGATATTTDTLGVATGPTTTATYSIHYIANISGSTPAGTYATNITYIATPLF